MIRLNIGYVVRLVAGGPKMTVKSTEYDRITCIWFDANMQLQEAVFDADLLVLAVD